MKRLCSWCLKIIETANRTHVVYCSQGCKDADNLFKYHNSDEEINRKRHYHELTHPKEETMSNEQESLPLPDSQDLAAPIESAPAREGSKKDWHCHIHGANFQSGCGWCNPR
jgi:hypothetical protein